MREARAAGLSRVGLYRAADGHACIARVSVGPIVQCGCGVSAYYEALVGIGHLFYVEQRGPMCLPLFLPESKPDGARS